MYSSKSLSLSGYEDKSASVIVFLWSRTLTTKREIVEVKGISSKLWLDEEMLDRSRCLSQEYSSVPRACVRNYLPIQIFGFINLTFLRRFPIASFLFQLQSAFRFQFFVFSYAPFVSIRSFYLLRETDNICSAFFLLSSRVNLIV